jgi:ribosomal protein S18 acetylase RimI-like enzyme
MTHGSLRLRPFRIPDGPTVRNGLRDMNLPGPDGMNRLLSMSWLSVWWWLKKRYSLLYCIEVDSDCIGLTGLYDLKSDGSCEMTLIIFDVKNRRKGYGTRVFSLLAENLSAHGSKIAVRTRKDNGASVSFWKKLGFKELPEIGGTKRLSIDLGRGIRQEAE